ncbi:MULTISPECIES: acyl-CoA dehydrogenase family protein [Nocardiaceae]|uniref:Alkylation response protein AidB-like acyl-CoA dehydrogenase n=1 Tax=Rhodococcoides corynebacterioides TaxID=53972 RepID=A0ABS2KMR6_9NOCA|nr:MULTISPECIES: acyl-CoA dehydrogenase family protein [Rhodococcus]MBM7413274.1 alkylation response protein AidB-like acyl-CoA dehydrogenase [Rhodococcus corynebacterioides]MBP1115737.1 alkylation response protein AidB-like acyl-CoA dehydrogenase [Rhodococcus sp. PvP016]
MTDTTSLDDFTATARSWLDARLPKRDRSRRAWGEGDDDVSVFHDLTREEESRLIAEASTYEQEKFDAGFGGITLPAEFGGRGLTHEHERAFRSVESAYRTPPSHELLTVTMVLVGNTIERLGTPEQKQRFLPALMSARELCCQLFSEPGAGSDLASVSTRAVRDGDEWVIDGQKVWSSGAQYAQWGICLARTNTDAPKHHGMTMFLVPLDAEGIDVRQIRQMSGGSTFNEVFLDGVRIDDSLRIGDVDGGWKVALTVLGFERGGGENRGGTYFEVLALARWLERTKDPIVRQRLATLYIQRRQLAVTARRARKGGPRAPHGSLVKLLYTQHQRTISETAADLLGPRLMADTGEWGTFAWTTFVTGAPGNRIAGGTDETQRNILGERVLGLPRERS